MNRQHLLTAGKWAWCLIVVVAAVAFISSRYEELRNPLMMLEAWHLLAGAGLLVGGKIMLAQLARVALAGEYRRYHLSRMLLLCSVAQLGKYVPGGIWHLVGRAVIYRTDGLTWSLASRAIARENGWLLLGAVCFGAMMCLLGLEDQTLAKSGLPPSLLRWAGPGGVGLIWIVGVWLSVRLPFVADAALHRFGDAVRILILQAGAWFLLGASVAVLAPGLPSAPTLAVIMGGFAIGWALGYITPFAPAGLGVREVGAAGIMALAIEPAEAAVLVGVARLLWTVVELGLGLAGYVGLRRSGQALRPEQQCPPS